MEPRLKWNKTILAAKIILFHFRRHAWNGSMWFHVKIKVDVTDTTVVPAYYGHDRRVYSTDPL